MDDFVHDDEQTQTALGLVIGWGHVGPSETGEDVFLLGSQQPLPESFGPLVVWRGLAQGAELAAPSASFSPGRLGAPRAFGQPLMSHSRGEA
jgi:hypothetical protein